jgi:tetratricopeptide (TPR) repeat protein
MDKFEDAIKSYDKAIELDPRFALAYDSRGTSKAVIKDYNGALSDYTRAIDLNPENAKAYYGSGYVKILLDKKEPGCADLKKSEKMGYKEAEKLLKQYCN